jgi:hypothetical protein
MELKRKTALVKASAVITGRNNAKKKMEGEGGR